MKKIINWLKRPINICLIYLIAFYGYSVFNLLSDNFDLLPKILFSFSVVMLTVYFVPWVLGFYKIKLFNNTDSLISGLIFLLVVDPNQSIWITFFMLCAYVVGRLAIRYKNFPIFNPVAFSVAIMVGASLFINAKPFVSWWGTSFSPRFTDYNFSIALLFTLPIGIYLAYKFRKLLVVLVAFLLTSFFFVINQMLDPQTTFNTFVSSYIGVFLEGTMFFALFIMLAEPKTSPAKTYSKIAYSVIFSIVWTIFTFAKLGNPVVFGIIAANIYYFGDRFITSSIKKSPKTVATVPTSPVASPTIVNPVVSQTITTAPIAESVVSENSGVYTTN